MITNISKRRFNSNKHNINELLYEQIQSDFTSDHFSYRAPHSQVFLAHWNLVTYVRQVEHYFCLDHRNRYLLFSTSLGSPVLVLLFTNIVKRIRGIHDRSSPHMGWLDSRSYHGAHLCQCLLTWCCTTLETSCFSEWISVNHQFWLQADRVGASPLPFRSCTIYADERHSDSVVDTFWQHRGVATPWLCWLNISEFLTNLVRSASSLSFHAFPHIGKSSLGFDNLSSLFKNEKLSRSWRPYMISAGDTWQSLSHQEYFSDETLHLKTYHCPGFLMRIIWS